MSSRRTTLPAQHPQAPRIKRKPPPSIDLEVRYPSPDPTDPFAPLWVLRNRSSNPSLSLAPSNDNSLYRKSSSYDLYPSILPFTVAHNDYAVPLEVLSNDEKSHYRRRSHSTPLTQLVPPLTFPSIQSSPLIFSHSERMLLVQSLADSTSDYGSASLTGTDLENMSAPVKSSSTSPESTPGKLARFLRPKRTQSSSPSIEKHGSLVPKRVGKISISSPVSVEHLAGAGRHLTDQAARSVNDLHSPQPHFTPLRRTATSDAPSPPRELDGCHSQPEALSLHYRARSPLSKTHTVDLLPPSPPPSTTSHSSSSYTHIPVPPSSTAHSTITSNDSFARPRTAPHPATSSSNSPYLRGHYPKSSAAPSSELFHPSQTEWAKPTISQLAYAASLPVIAESGLRVTFGSLFANQRTIVVFIRHFWCPLCQDYMTSLTSLAHPDMMYSTHPSSPFLLDADSEKVDQVQLVVISNGAHGFISKYRQIFNMPFSMYTDPSLALYLALGMGRDGGRKVPSVPPPSPGTSMHRHRQRTEESDEKEQKGVMLDGGYVMHGIVRGIAMVVGRAVKAGMPVWEKGGDIGQLGGEFVFGPGLSCTYAHRMQSAKGHVPIRDVLKAAGVTVRIPEPSTPATSTSDSYVSALRGLEVGSQSRLKKRRNTMQDFGAKLVGRKQSVDSGSSKAMSKGSRRLARMSSQEVERMAGRVKSLDNLRQRKDLRRGGGADDPTNGEFCLSGTGHCSPVIEEDIA